MRQPGTLEVEVCRTRKNSSRSVKRRTSLQKPLHGFTLVELLVVIAIIALLMGILMPALNKVRRLAKATVCRTNVRQWGLVFKLYGEDNDATLPQSIRGGTLNAAEAYWIVATLPYYKAKDIRFCPSTKVVHQPGSYRNTPGSTLASWGPLTGGGADPWYADFDTGSYGINDWCATPPTGNDWYWEEQFLTKNAWKTQLAKGADRIPLFGDCATVEGFALDNDKPPTEEPPPYNGWNPDSNGWWNSNAMRVFCLPRHEGAVNLVFLDGSVGAVPLRALWKLKWHENFDTNGLYTERSYSWPQWMLKFGDEY